MMDKVKMTTSPASFMFSIMFSYELDYRDRAALATWILLPLISSSFLGFISKSKFPVNFPINCKDNIETIYTIYTFWYNIRKREIDIVYNIRKY